MLFRKKRALSAEYNENDYDPWKDMVHSKCLRTLFFPFCFSIVILIVSLISTSFAEFWCRTVGGFFRKALACITGFLPFSLAETLLFAGVVLLLYGIIRCIAESIRRVPYPERFERRFQKAILAVVLFCFTFFALNFAPCNNRVSLEENLGFERAPVSDEQLYKAVAFTSEKLSECLTTGDIRRSSSGLSCLPYSYEEMTEKVLDAYEKAYDDYPFLTRMRAPVKRIALSGLMTYTHISGIYIPYTGEANININYPDYVIAFSAAHEMAHQRGISHEDEANFVAFLVLYNSDDNYLRYSALCELYNYLSDALYSANTDLFTASLYITPREVLREMMGFSDFFTPYSGSTASKVADSVNDVSIQLRGDKEGSKSYDMMVDLAVAYFGIE